MSQNVEHEVVITGVLPAAVSAGDVQPSVYPRRPIEELVKDEKQFSLYVQAIDMLMKRDHANVLSWFQISGIHGAPVQPWDNVQGLPHPTFGGYCTHGSVLFPTWHRAYVLLFEQALVGCAVTIAEGYTDADADEWKQAAISLRSPYWDWAHNPVPLDEVIRHRTLTVAGPNGGKVVLDPNPLQSYNFRGNAPAADPRQETIRCPNGEPSDLDALIESLEALHRPLRDPLRPPNDPMRKKIWKMLTQATTWDVFSNKNARSSSSGINSLEILHDKIHTTVGGGGQMSDPSVAAFDPIFWLHHTNVDRLLAFWQALHPDIWVSSGTANTFTLQGGIDVNEDTDLTPFWNGATSFFKSSSIGMRQWKRLNYDYPEFAELAEGTDTRVAITATVNHLYNSPVPAAHNSPINAMSAEQQFEWVSHPTSSLVARDAGPRAVRGIPSAAVDVKAAASGEEFARLRLAGDARDKSQITIPHIMVDDSTPRLDWFARIRVQANKVGSSFTVLFFVGEPPEHERKWRSADNLIGIHAEFVNSHPEECANCRENAETVTEGFVDLTGVLRSRGLYERAEREIEEYLSRDLEWRIQKTDATIVAAEEVPGLEIEVMTMPLEFSEQWQDWVNCDENPTPRNFVTAGRAGGCPLPQQ